MKALLQRVSQARVDVAGECVGAIAGGLLVLVGVEPQDTPASADKLLHKLLNYRVFNDAAGKMNLSLKDVAGGLLLVSQFTLAADTGKGMRPSFSGGAHPSDAERLYDYFVVRAREAGMPTETGRFAADMKVRLLNDGPVTFWLQV